MLVIHMAPYYSGEPALSAAFTCGLICELHVSGAFPHAHLTFVQAMRSDRPLLATYAGPMCEEMIVPSPGTAARTSF